MTNLDSILKNRNITLPTKVCLVKAMVFPLLMYGYESWTLKKSEGRRMMILNFGIRKDSWEFLGLQGNQIRQSSRKSILNILWKDWSWSLNANTLATSCEEMTHLKRPWCWERLKLGGEGDDRGWDGWMASPTWWTWVWARSRSWWWTRRLVCCSPWGLKELDTAEQLNWTELH